jgi:phosphoribosylformimino-5-aminoimidazole carboxamide ribonucleotide (ProFAR) isomerase
VSDILQGVAIPVQVAGGIRSIEAAQDLLADLQAALARAYPASAAVASRAKNFSIGSGRWMP